jgi:periplasmic protein TonB
MEWSPAVVDPSVGRYCARPPKGRAAAAALTAELLIIISLIYGLAGTTALVSQRPASLFSTSLDPPPPEQHRLKSSTATNNGRAAPPALKAEAAPLVVPRFIVVPRQPLPAASFGPRTGAALQPGLGSGAGGQGSGTGSGTGGNGTGSGNGDGGGSDAEWTGGKIKNGDYPKALREAHISGTTVAEVAVGSNGRPTACRVIRTSGNRELDMTTCQLIMQRFKFKPARNSAGAAISGSIEYEQEWDAPPPPPPD